ncbi:hypothetical protein [Halosimplex pelagicum]|uniref:Lipoprotein n=1 Tax=Halosimplex pelagicum TaxID=869886 RepID=A0A7D5T9C2_9EURY|nr:hypothetical protein [Halosimplex pelagicum]QLH81750.1 hypothetical protein HZS54_08970 [Halosimplex pelagicum]
MSELLSRRRLLLSGVALSSLLSGCHSDTHASLLFGSIEVSDNDSTYEIEFEVRLSVGGDWESFKNVSAVGLDKNGTVICRQHIGEIDADYVGGDNPVTLTCDEFPHALTYEIERDPCSRGVTVNKMAYDEERDLWVEEPIECE